MINIILYIQLKYYKNLRNDDNQEVDYIYI